MSVCLSHASLLAALGLEGGAVRIFKPRDRPFYHVFFRHQGKQVNRSTGTAVYAKAQENGARIFAEVIRGPQSLKQESAFESLKQKFETFLASQAAAGGGVQNPVTQNKPRPTFLKSIPATIGAAIADFFAERPKEKFSKTGEEQLARRLRSFAKHANKSAPLDVITPELVSCWSSIKNDLDAINQFARWCIRADHKWLDPDLVNALPKGNKKKDKVGYEDLWPAASLEKLLRHVEKTAPQYILFYAICAFSGVRPNKEKNKGEGDSGEVVRLLASVQKRGWDAHLKETGLWVAESKNGDPRLAYTPDVLRAWIARYPTSIATPTQAWHRNHLSKLFPMPKNTFRKTCAAAYTTLFGPAHAPSYFGNSEDMLRKYYVPGIIPTPQAKAWFDIWPVDHVSAAAVAA